MGLYKTLASSYYQFFPDLFKNSNQPIGNFDGVDIDFFRRCNPTAVLHHQRKSRANSLELPSETDKHSFTNSDFNVVLELLLHPSDGEQPADDTNDMSLDCLESAESNQAEDDFPGKTVRVKLVVNDSYSHKAPTNTISDDSDNKDSDVAVEFNHSFQVENDHNDDGRKTIYLNQADPIYPIFKESKPVNNQSQFIPGLSALLDLHLLIHDYFDLVFTSCLFSNLNGTDNHQYYLQRMSLLKSIKEDLVQYAVKYHIDYEQFNNYIKQLESNESLLSGLNCTDKKILKEDV